MKILLLPRSLLPAASAMFTISFLAFLVPNSASQAPAEAPPSRVAPPRITSEQRREFAEIQERLMADAEYKAAVNRAIEAQRAADNLFFTKMAKAASPELQGYIKFLQQSRASVAQ